MKQKLSVLLALCFCVSMLCCSALADVTNANDVSTGTLSDVGAFPDVPATAPYAEAVNTLHEYGIINGDNKGNFNPNSTITRAEAATIICRIAGVEDAARKENAVIISDVPTSHWANGYITMAKKQGIIDGYGNGKFGPNDSVTYAQILKMIICEVGYEDEAIQKGGYPDGYIAVANELNVTKGVMFDKSKPAPRCDVARFLFAVMTLSDSYEGGYIE